MSAQTPRLAVSWLPEDSTRGGTGRATGGSPLGAVPALGHSGGSGTGVPGLSALPGAALVPLEALREGWGLRKFALMHPCAGPLAASGGKQRSRGGTAASSVAFQNQEEGPGHRDSLKPSSLTLAKSKDSSLASASLRN